jgi:hypothetical protein
MRDISLFCAVAACTVTAGASSFSPFPQPTARTAQLAAHTAIAKIVFR